MNQLRIPEPVKVPARKKTLVFGSRRSVTRQENAAKVVEHDDDDRIEEGDSNRDSMSTPKNQK